MDRVPLTNYVKMIVQMSDDDLLVLDNTVLSAYYVADWLASLTFWQDRYNIATTGRVWNTEFKPHHELSETPEWLSIRDGDIDTLSITGIGQLGEVDWSCIALASSAENNRLVTNDYQ